MFGIWLKSLGLCILTSFGCVAIGSIFELSQDHVGFLGVLSGLIIYTTYSAPQMDQYMRAKLEAKEAEIQTEKATNEQEPGQSSGDVEDDASS
jgi:hypothetical protein